jgi:hypothetical protein
MAESPNPTLPIPDFSGPGQNTGTSAVPFDPIPTSNPTTAPGVPQVPSQTTSGSGTSPGNGGTSTQPFGANIAPSIKSNFQIKEKLLRPALTSNYQCWFNPPAPVISWLTEKGLNFTINKELISLSCSEASLPGSSFMTNEITDDYTGITERHAYRRAYDDRVDFTFYVDHGRSDGNYNVLWFFEKWMQYIVNEQDALGLDTRQFYYRIRFPEQYQTDNLFINKFERDFKGQYLQYKFMQAYPISLNSIPVSYDSSQLLKVTVSFTYTRYLTKRSNNELPQEPNQPTAPGIPPITTPEGDVIPPGPVPGSPPGFPAEPVVALRTRRIGTNPGEVNPGGGNIVV